MNHNFSSALRAAARAYDETVDDSGSPYEQALSLLTTLAAKLDWSGQRNFRVANGIEIYAENEGTASNIDNYTATCKVATGNRVVVIRPCWTQMGLPSEYDTRAWIVSLSDPMMFNEFLLRIGEHNRKAKERRNGDVATIRAMSAALDALPNP